MSFDQLFLYIPGIIIFLAGSGAYRTERLRSKFGESFVGTVLSCNHIVKKDPKNRVVQEYYNILVEYFNGKKTISETSKSPNEYSVGQQLLIYHDRGKVLLADQKEEALIPSLAMAIAGALLIVMALMQNQGRQLAAMLILALILTAAGILLIVKYFSRKKRNLLTLQAEIIDVFKRQISKESKIIKGEKFTYYPIVSYEIDGRKNIRRCIMNASRENEYKIGESIPLYYDSEKRCILEQGAKISILIWGILLLAVGILALAGTIPGFV